MHASWLNQIEIYFFSIVQRKVLFPNDFADLGFWSSASSPFRNATNGPPSRFCLEVLTRDDLDRLLSHLAEHHPPLSSSPAA